MHASNILGPRTKPRRKLVPMAKLADDYGRIKSKIKDLEDLLFLVRAQLVESGESYIDGKFFTVTISNAEKVMLDAESLRAAYPGIITQFEKISQSIVVCCNSK